MDFHRDKFAKTVSIPVKVVDGNLVYYYDTPPLESKEGAIGDVILPEWAVLNPEARQKWQAEQRIALFDVGTSLFLGMKAERVPSPLWRELIEPQVLSEARNLLLVKVVLRGPLFLGLRGTKKAVLRGGGCVVGSAPLLPDGPHTDAGDRLLTFADLIELKFVALFRREGVTLPTIRAAPPSASRANSV